MLVVGGGPAGLVRPDQHIAWRAGDPAGIDLETAAGFPGRRLGTLVPGTS